MAERHELHSGAGWEVRKADRALPAERLDFIRKVYSLFFAALLVAAGGVYVGFTNPATFFQARWALFIGTIVLLLVVGFSKTARRTRPWNYLLLFGVNFLVGLTIGPWVFAVEAAGKGAVLLQAFIMASGIFGALTAYAWFSRKDFSFLGGFLTVGIFGLLLATIVYMFIPGATGLGFAIACVGVLVMAGFTLFDTSRILHRYDTDEYVAGALDLFMDFYLLFWYIAQIFLGSSRD
jgi:FtsH-binding integral membrane protein